jgi:hypothetical protein
MAVVANQALAYVSGAIDGSTAHNHPLTISRAPRLRQTPGVEVIVIARAELDLAAALDGQCAVAIKLKLNEPFWYRV